MSRHFCCPSRHNVVSLSRASCQSFLSRQFAKILSPKCLIFLKVACLAEVADKMGRTYFDMNEVKNSVSFFSKESTFE